MGWQDAPMVDEPASSWQDAPMLDASSGPVKIGKDAFADTLREELRKLDWGTRNMIGMGTAVTNLWEGIKQFAGKENQGNITANRVIREEAPVGAITGDVALTALPFGMAGNSLKAAGLVGAAYGALQPVEANNALDVVKGKALNTTVGGGSGVAGQFIGNKAGQWVGNKAAAMATRKAQNATKDAAMKEAIGAGYKVPPSMMPDSGTTVRTLEGLSGKHKTNQLAGIKNQEVTNRLAKQSLGIADDQPLSMSAIEKVRESAYQPYREISKLTPSKATTPSGLMNAPGKPSFSPAKALEDLKQSRSDAKGWFDAYNRSANPEQLAKAKAYQATADALESDLESYATGLGRSDLVDRLVEARKTIAKTYTVERAMKKGSGDVDAKVIGRLFEKGKPLSDGLDTVGKFGATFGDVAGIPKSGNASPLTALDFMQIGGTGPLGMIAMGHPAGAALAAIPPAARVMARYSLLSSPVQSLVANPSYNVPIASRMAGGLLQYAPIGGTALALESLR